MQLVAGSRSHLMVHLEAIMNQITQSSADNQNESNKHLNHMRNLWSKNGKNVLQP